MPGMLRGCFVGGHGSLVAKMFQRRCKKLIPTYGVEDPEKSGSTYTNQAKGVFEAAESRAERAHNTPAKVLRTLNSTT